jgi:hypothetical protein
MSKLAKIFLKSIIAGILIIYTVFLPKNALASFKGCSVNPTQVQKGQEVTLTIKSDNGKIDDGLISVYRGGRTNKVREKHFSDQSKTTTRDVNLGSFNEDGFYSVKASGIRGDRAVQDVCWIDNAFVVSSTNNNPNPPKLEAPTSPVTTPTLTLATLKISGLDPNKTYQLHLGGKWSGHEIGISGDNDWHAPGGIITASSICENGNANRSNCSHRFQDGPYLIHITEGESGPSPGDVQFEVKAVGPAGVAGENPCLGGECKTAIGEISTNPTKFVGTILITGIGIAGGIALIIMVLGSIKILMSSGDPKKVGEGREMIVAAVSGLLFLILSVLILRFIGVTFLPTNPF